MLSQKTTSNSDQPLKITQIPRAVTSLSLRGAISPPILSPNGKHKKTINFFSDCTNLIRASTLKEFKSYGNGFGMTVESSYLPLIT